MYSYRAKHVFFELLLIVGLLLLHLYFLGYRQVVINADGKGYYDYLPATFIYHDLNFGFIDTLHTNYYQAHAQHADYLNTVKGKRIDKYFPGTAILQAPFFLAAHGYTILSDSYQANGYSLPYQKGIVVAALFYLFVALVFIRKLLNALQIKMWVIQVVQAAFVFATPIIIYTEFDSSYSHVYSFAVISAFTYFAWKFIRKPCTKTAVIIGLLLGMILITRPVNGLVVFTPLLFFNSFRDTKLFVRDLFIFYKKPLIYGIVIFIGVISIVPMLWYAQTGHFFIWGYQGEGFHFLQPHFFEFLFGFRKGAFLHTPLLAFSVLGAMWVWMRSSKFYLTMLFIGLLLLIFYVLSSWWAWWYGASFGSRPLIDFYVIFAIGFATFLQHIRSVWAKGFAFVTLIALAVINIIQVYQYKHYIIDWGEMTKEKFTTIGLHIEDKYQGIYFRPRDSYSENNVVYSVSIPLTKPYVFVPDHRYYFSPVIDSALIDLEFNRVFIETDIEYAQGSIDFILVLDDVNGENKIWHAQNVFGLTLKDHTRKTVSLPYVVGDVSGIGKATIGINTRDDSGKIHQLRLVFVHR